MPASRSQFFTLSLLSLLMTGMARSAVAAPPIAAGEASQQFIHQQEQQRALEQQLQPVAPQVRLSLPDKGSSGLHFPVETPCFTLSRVTLNGTRQLPGWLALQRLSRQAEGHCLGAKGINLLMSALQNRLIDSGYITSRVLAPQQDLSSGGLLLVVMPGILRNLSLTPDSGRHITLATAFPARQGRLLDLRDIEQGLENLQRLPTVQAEMEILPADTPGESDIAVRWQQQKIWRVAMSLDDSGTRDTGRYQGGLTLSLDNPFSFSDLFYLSGSGSLENHSGRGAANLTGHYSLPFGNWLAGLTLNRYDYHLTSAGLNGDYRYSGQSNNLTFSLSKVLHRSSRQKTTLSYDVLAREAKNFINDTEIQIQRRRTSAWRIGLQHRHYISQATLDAAVSYQQGTRWFGALPAPEETFGEATALGKIGRFSAQLAIPFALARQSFLYNLQYQQQFTATRLTPQDQFAIGNRWTVRGFDGERTLNGDRGWLVRNDLGWVTPLAAQELYLALDYGETGGSSAHLRPGNHLAGGAAGLRGQWLNTRYDLFAARPLSKPDGFKTDSLTLGFSLNWQY